MAENIIVVKKMSQCQADGYHFEHRVISIVVSGAAVIRSTVICGHRGTAHPAPFAFLGGDAIAITHAIDDFPCPAEPLMLLYQLPQKCSFVEPWLVCQ